MKKTLIYGALGGVALYLYLQLQKKKKLSTKETSSTKQDDASGTSIPSGTGGIKPPKPITPPIVKPKPIEKVPPMSVTTPKGEGDGVSVKNDAPTPPAPTVEPIYGGIKPPKPTIIKEPKVVHPQPNPNPILTKPVIKPRPIATDRPIVKPPLPIKPVVSEGIVDVKDFVIPRITSKRPTRLIR